MPCSSRARVNAAAEKHFEKGTPSRAFAAATDLRSAPPRDPYRSRTNSALGVRITRVPCRAREDARVVAELLEAVQDPHSVELADLEVVGIEGLAADVEAPGTAVGDHVGVHVDARGATSRLAGEVQEGPAVAADLGQPGARDDPPRPDAAGIAIELGPPLATQLVERARAVTTPRVAGHVVAAHREGVPERAPARAAPVDGPRVVVDEAVEAAAGSRQIAADGLGGAQQRRGRRATHDAATSIAGPMTPHTLLIPGAGGPAPSAPYIRALALAIGPRAFTFSGPARSGRL
jgi:hypothetical protein